MRRRIREEEPIYPSTQVSGMQESDLSAVARRRNTEPSRLNRLMRGELDWIVMKALEKDRNRRYETAAEFSLDIQRYLQFEPLEGGSAQLSLSIPKVCQTEQRSADGRGHDTDLAGGRLGFEYVSCGEGNHGSARSG